MREAEAKPHLRQGTWRVRAHALVVTALRLTQVPSHTRLFSLLRISASTQELLGSLREEQGGSGTSGGQLAAMRGQGGRHGAEPSRFCPGTGNWENSSWDISADRVIQHMGRCCFSQQSLKGEISQGMVVMGLPNGLWK